MSEQKIPIPAMIYNAAVGGHVTNSQQIIDEDYNLEQKDINKETLGVPYNASNPNGMGKIVLKKNDNFKQVIEAQTDGNTIFVIKYDYTLTGDVTVPTNCVLEFDGGSISGEHNINFNGCIINADDSSIIFKNSAFSGGIKNATAYSKWFGCTGDGITDDADRLQKFLDCGSSTLKMSRGAYALSHSIRLQSDKELDCSWCTFKPLANNISLIEIVGYNTNPVTYLVNTVLRNFKIVIESGFENVIGLKVGPAVYFNYIYDFNIICIGTNNIGIYITNNFNTIIRDGRIIGSKNNDSWFTGNYGIYMTSDNTAFGNGQVTNVLVDSVLVQRFEKGIALDYPTGAHDTFELRNIGFSQCNNGFYFNGEINATITNFRAENTIKAINAVKTRSITVKDIYLMEAGFLSFESGQISLCGYLYAMNVGSQLMSQLQFLNMSGGVLCVGLDFYSKWSGYGVQDVQDGSIYDTRKVLHNNFENAYHNVGSTEYNSSNGTASLKLGTNAKRTLSLEKQYINRSTVPSTNSNFLIVPGINVYSITNNIASIGKGTGTESGFQFRVVSGDNNAHKLWLDNVLNAPGGNFLVSPYNSLLFEVVITNDVFKLKLLSNNNPIGRQVGETQYRPTLTDIEKGSMFFDINLNKPIWWNGTDWVDATGATV